MRKALLGLAFALTLMSALTVLVAAQDGGVGRFQPFAVNVLHQEPITVTSTTTLASGEVVTLTTPLTLSVDLRINVTGATVASIESGGATASSVELVIATPQPAPAGTEGFEDSSGRIYTAEAPDDIAIGQVQSKENILGSEFIGQITNDGEDSLDFVMVTVQLYAEDGTLLSVDTGFASMQEIAPGKSSPFQVLSQIDYADVAGYAVQVQP